MYYFKSTDIRGGGGGGRRNLLGAAVGATAGSL